MKHTNEPLILIKFNSLLENSSLQVTTLRHRLKNKRGADIDKTHKKKRQELSAYSAHQSKYNNYHCKSVYIYMNIYLQY
jgi:hypothetical protein